MARALIVGCGCRGRSLGRVLLDAGWQVRGTSRTEAGIEAIEAAGLEGGLADPDRAGTVLDHVEDVAVVVWALASATGSRDALEAAHGPRLERVLEKLVDSPVRGFVYERVGSVPDELLAVGVETVSSAANTWRIPVGWIDADPADPEAWVRDAERAVLGVLA